MNLKGVEIASSKSVLYITHYIQALVQDFVKMPHDFKGPLSGPGNILP